MTCIPEDFEKSHNYQASIIARNLSLFSFSAIEPDKLPELDAGDSKDSESASPEKKRPNHSRNYEFSKSIVGKDIYFDEDEPKSRKGRGRKTLEKVEESKPRRDRGSSTLERVMSGGLKPNSKVPLDDEDKISPHSNRSRSPRSPMRAKLNLKKCERKRAKTCPTIVDSAKLDMSNEKWHTQGETEDNEDTMDLPKSKGKKSTSHPNLVSAGRSATLKALSSRSRSPKSSTRSPRNRSPKSTMKNTSKLNVPKCEMKRSQTCPSISNTKLDIQSQTRAALRTTVRSPRQRRRSLALQKLTKRAEGKTDAIKPPDLDLLESAHSEPGADRSSRSPPRPSDRKTRAAGRRRRRLNRTSNAGSERDTEEEPANDPAASERSASLPPAPRLSNLEPNLPSSSRRQSVQRRRYSTHRRSSITKKQARRASSTVDSDPPPQQEENEEKLTRVQRKSVLSSLFAESLNSLEEANWSSDQNLDLNQ